ncbi:hypothetical protein DFP72DRAFT_1046527 [Ephemerocybe angulata]|uniref:Uncharacterized protein n=1 Tax=Ephemerocybe angulata TaxID=980116 RepID=A0A8H6M5H1_9AGAR|nr:hypothetical protein DFP72DRAFT_1046527 [Tulosesus angulatus]
MQLTHQVFFFLTIAASWILGALAIPVRPQLTPIDTSGREQNNDWWDKLPSGKEEPVTPQSANCVSEHTSNPTIFNISIIIWTEACTHEIYTAGWKRLLPQAPEFPSAVQSPIWAKFNPLKWYPKLRESDTQVWVLMRGIDGVPTSSTPCTRDTIHPAWASTTATQEKYPQAPEEWQISPNVKPVPKSGGGKAPIRGSKPAAARKGQPKKTSAAISAKAKSAGKRC